MTRGLLRRWRCARGAHAWRLHAAAPARTTLGGGLIPSAGVHLAEGCAACPATRTRRTHRLPRAYGPRWPA